VLKYTYKKVDFFASSSFCFQDGAQKSHPLASSCVVLHNETFNSLWRVLFHTGLNLKPLAETFIRGAIKSLASRPRAFKQHMLEEILC